MKELIVKIENLHKIYKTGKGIETHALRGVNIQIEKGEFICVEGPSGSGKTTLLNLIGGLDYPTKGKIFVMGKEISSMDQNTLSEFRLRNLGFIFQEYNLIQVLSAIENVEFPLILQGIPEKKAREKALEMLEAVDLKDKANKMPTELSGGEQQRVAVARALVTEPLIVLADEPTANLDSKNALNLINLMRKLNEEKEVTFIFSSHDKKVIDSAKRVIRLRDGMVED